VEIGDNNGDGTAVNTGVNGGASMHDLESSSSSLPIWAIVIISIAALIAALTCAYAAVGVSRWRERKREKKERDLARFASAGGPLGAASGDVESGWIATRARAAAEEAKRKQALERKTSSKTYQSGAGHVGPMPYPALNAVNVHNYGAAGNVGATVAAGAGAAGAAGAADRDVELGRNANAHPVHSGAAVNDFSNIVPAGASGGDADGGAGAAAGPVYLASPDSPVSALHVQSLKGTAAAAAAGGGGGAMSPAAGGADAQHALPHDSPVQQQYNYTFDDGEYTYQ
jgi:hypothetical protein